MMHVTVIFLLAIITAAPLHAATDDELLLRLRSTSDQTERLKQRATSLLLAFSRVRISSPGAQHLRIFVRVNAGEIRLDRLEVVIAGQSLKSQTYTEQETDALVHGGIQKFFDGSIAENAGLIEVKFQGRRMLEEPSIERDVWGDARTVPMVAHDLVLNLDLNHRHDVLLATEWRALSD